MYIGLHAKYPLLLSDFNEILIFLTDLKKKNSNINFMKIHTVGTNLFHVDRQTNLTKLTVALCNFVNAPKKQKF